MSVSQTPDDCAEKAVKILLDNHRLLLTLVGFFIAGLFSYAGRSSSVLEWRYFTAQTFFVVAGVLIVAAVSATIDQARKGRYNAYAHSLTIPYISALVLIGAALCLTGWFMIEPPLNDGTPPKPTPLSGIRIEGQNVEIAPDAKLKVKTQFNSVSGKIEAIEIGPN